jgi:hypothetical protein
MKEKRPSFKTSNTHGFIQQVLCHKGIPQSLKTVLIYCLEKYQAIDNQGKSWTFSNAGIQLETCLSIRSVEVATKTLRKHKVLKECGTMRYSNAQDRPTTLYFFVLEALKTYLEVNAKVQKSIIRNASADETDVDITENGVVNAEVNATIALYKKKGTKNKENISTSTVNPDPTSLNEMEKEMNAGFYVSSSYIQGSVSGSSNENKNKGCVGVGCSLQGSPTNTENKRILNPGVESVGVCQGAGTIPPSASGNRNVIAKNSNKHMPGSAPKVPSSAWGGIDGKLGFAKPKDESQEILDLLDRTIGRWTFAQVPEDIISKRTEFIMARFDGMSHKWEAEELLREVTQTIK